MCRRRICQAGSKEKNLVTGMTEQLISETGMNTELLISIQGYEFWKKEQHLCMSTNMFFFFLIQFSLYICLYCPTNLLLLWQKIVPVSLKYKLDLGTDLLWECFVRVLFKSLLINYIAYKLSWFNKFHTENTLVTDMKTMLNILHMTIGLWLKRFGLYLNFKTLNFQMNFTPSFPRVLVCLLPFLANFPLYFKIFSKPSLHNIFNVSLGPDLEEKRGVYWQKRTK